MDFTRDGSFDLQDIVLLATAISVVIGACVLVMKQIVKPIATWTQKQFREAVNETITGPLEEIRHEVTANDGGSLKDLVAKNHQETLQIFQQRDERFAELAAPAADRLAAVEDAVTAHIEDDRIAFAETRACQEQILAKLDKLGTQSDKSGEILDKLNPDSP